MTVTDVIDAHVLVDESHAMIAAVSTGTAGRRGDLDGDATGVDAPLSDASTPTTHHHHQGDTPMSAHGDHVASTLDAALRRDPLLARRIPDSVLTALALWDTWQAAADADRPIDLIPTGKAAS